MSRPNLIEIATTLATLYVRRHAPEPGPGTAWFTDKSLLLIEIVSSDGAQEFDLNSLIISVVEDGLDFTPLMHERSDISGKPAILYRRMDLELRLTPAELRRMVCHRLRKKEFFALRDRYGLEYEWHEDFYDPVTGKASPLNRIDLS